MAQNDGTVTSTFTNRTPKLLYPHSQHFWTGTPITAPGRIPPGSTAQGQQRATAEGALKFATVYVDSEKELPTTRKFISAFDVSFPKGFGPYGSQLSNNYSMILGPDETIKEVIVRHGEIVDALGFVVADKTGTTTTKLFGGNLGNESKILLKSDEYITQLSGTHGRYYSQNLIATLKIHTNLNPEGYGPYGHGKPELVENPSNFVSPSGQIVGFFGRHNHYLESVGVYLVTGAPRKAYAESGPFGPIDWNVVEVKLGLSKPSDVYEDNILGGKVEATVYPNGDAGAIYS